MSRRTDRPGGRLALLALKLVISLYPARFRTRFGGNALAMARQSLAEAAVESRTALAAAIARELASAVAGLGPEHRRERRHRTHRSKEDARMSVTQSLRDDIRAAARSLRHAPSFTGVVLLILGVGIGASTAIFSVADAVALRGLPFPDADRLMAVLEVHPDNAETFGGGRTTPQTFLDWRREQDVFESFASARTVQFWRREASGTQTLVMGSNVSGGFFDVLGVRPVLGRGITRDDEQPGDATALVLTHGYWQREFAGDPAVLGRRLTFSDAEYRVVGVLPRGFVFPTGQITSPELFAARVYRESDTVRPGARNFNEQTIGRLAPGVTRTEAAARLSAITAALDAEFPDWFNGRRADVVPLGDFYVGKVRGWMWMLLASVALLLLIACANVASLMLARATQRGREVGLRAALGASRWRIARALLVESLMLSMAAAAIGVLLAAGGIRVAAAWLPDDVPRLASIALDWRVLAAAAAAAIGTGLAFGAAPAWHASRVDLAGVLRLESRSSTASRATRRLRAGLVVSEVALATVLLVGAGLFLGSFIALMRVDPGFDHRNVLAVDIGVPWNPADREGMYATGRQYVADALNAVRALPDVVGAEAVSGGVPLTGSWMRMPVSLPGRGELEGDEYELDTRYTTPGYLAMLGVPLKAGRYLTEDDHAGADRVIVINEASAARYWPGESPLNRIITLEDVDRRVVGVVGNIRHGGPESPQRQEGYVPFSQYPYPSGATLTIRTAAPPEAVLPSVKAAIWRLRPDQRFTTDALSLASYLDQLIAERRFNMAILVLFGVLGLLISAAGIYGVIAYLVAQRTREFGVRLALGATRGSVMGLVLAGSTRLIAAGLVIGAGVAWSLAGWLDAFLFQLEPGDPRVFAAAALVLVVAGLLAASLPARRAARVDPLTALRSE